LKGVEGRWVEGVKGGRAPVEGVKGRWVEGVEGQWG
jgi:hypothetical protein